MLGIYWEIAGADSPIRRKPAPGIISGFFEWKRIGNEKRPFKIYLQDEQIMSIAGVWNTWHPGQPDEGHSFSILTTAANEFMRDIHDRMPVILGRGDEEAWIDPDFNEPNGLQQLLRPCASSWLSAVQVSSLVNAAKNNSPDVLRTFVEQDRQGVLGLFD